MSEKKITFGRIFWPSLLSALIVSILGLVIWLIVITSVVSGFKEKKGVDLAENSILHMKLEGTIAEKGQTAFNPADFSMNQQTGLSGLLHGFEVAKTDDKIKGIYIELGVLSCGYATAREIRNAINDFEKSGKFVVAYNSGEVVPLKSYYVASAANENYGFPTSAMEFLGIGAERVFFKNMLEDLDIELQIFRGKENDFKSAVEPFFNDRMSDSSRLQTERYLASMWEDIREEIAADRNLRPEVLNVIADSMKIRYVEDAVAHKLVDAVKYKDEILDLLAAKTGMDDSDEINLYSFTKYAKKHFSEDQLLLQSTEDANIAVILAEGGVTKSGEGLTSDQICDLFREVRDNASVKTVVFRVNSPGGSALASDEIWREVKLTNETKKVVVSMGDVAASGGYYISAPASAIFAEPTTITGSIGVFGMVPYTGKMLENKLGLTFDRAGTNPHAVLTTNRKLDENEVAIIQESVDDIYTQFKHVVAQGRGMTMDQVQVVARGRVWTGKDAREIGLVDQLGGITDAIRYAAEKAGIKEQKVLYYPNVKEDKLGQFLEQLSEEENMQMEADLELPESLLKHYEQVKSLEDLQGLQMRLPFILDIR